MLKQIKAMIKLNSELSNNSNYNILIVNSEKQESDWSMAVNRNYSAGNPNLKVIDLNIVIDRHISEEMACAWRCQPFEL